MEDFAAFLASQMGDSAKRAKKSDESKEYQAPKHVKPDNLPRIFAEIKRCRADELDRKLTADAELRAQINATPAHKGTPLCYAIWKAASVERLGHVSVLIKHGADVNLGDITPGHGYDECLPPMFVAVKRMSLPCMAILFRAGADMSAVIETYSRKKLDPKSTTHQMNLFSWALNTAFFRSRRENPMAKSDPIDFLECVKLLMTKYGKPALDVLTHNINLRMPVINKTMLGVAAKMTATGTIKLLLQLGADPNLSDKDGWTPLHTACMQDDVDVVALLLRYGARDDLRTEDSNCWMPTEKASNLTRQYVRDAIHYRQWLAANADFESMFPLDFTVTSPATTTPQ